MIYKTLNNNVKMPQLGFGVYQTPIDETKHAVLDAIEVGYRSFDTAQAYQNEEGVGQAIKESGLPREEFFITTKIWISNAGYEKAKASIQESLQKLQTNHLEIITERIVPWKKPIKLVKFVQSGFLTFHRIVLSIYSISLRSSQLSIKLKPISSNNKK